ncbi:sugar transferase [Parasphingorhabdus sp.]|uniref:sugar transferase n=1 Tax=Parasphingorhabdus sp. TaxID=2709688 RepID=UPI003A94FEBB
MHSSPIYDFAKRIFDLLVVLVTLPVWMPLMLIGIFIVLVVSPGNPFYSSRRVGRYGKDISILKIRSMVKNADQIGSGVTTLGDSRIIPLGRMLRLTKIDEMPQFFSVLSGQISIVGPRPELREFVDQYGAEERKIILSVKPGIIDYGTLAFSDLQRSLAADGKENENEILEKLLERKKQLRLQYVSERSMLKDFSILVRTPVAMLKAMVQK